MSFKNTLAWGTALIASGIGLGAQAGQLTLDVGIKQQTVAEYHKPYVAGWIEDASGAHVGNIFVWYDIKKRDGAGQKWLNDLRTWWRKSGRDLTLPVDGLSGATRAPGRQTLTVDTATIKDLKPGAYIVVVEAAREAGGHDLVKVPLNWSPAKPATGSAKGDGELSDVKVSYKP
jgi:hypothetical protein